MLLARYFLSVGGVLLGLLFVADAVVPTVPAIGTDRNDTGADKSVIRIHSDRKWPEPVVFDTSSPNQQNQSLIEFPSLQIFPENRAGKAMGRPRKIFFAL